KWWRGKVTCCRCSPDIDCRCPFVTFQDYVPSNALQEFNIELGLPGLSCLVRFDKHDREKDNPHTRGLANAPCPAGLCHGSRQRLASPRRKRRRALPVLPLGPSDAGAVRSRTVGLLAETGRFDTVAGRRCSCYE